ncbi:hypothetical protein VP1G_08451 [Cytospora mali]|uniref:Uncharacterized protein n=1 Tax=Cytospora mali TaxID=578113 RepID=A0A194VBY6_CYTMA|nr:hypothetical protein VP1G_08451 [Valsa mali var. pyri (nom. inval.)]
MFSSSVTGGSVCVRCQLRAVTRRAIPSVAAAAQIHGPRRQYSSEATKPDAHEDDLETILRTQRHDESRQRQSTSAWTQNGQQKAPTTSKHVAVEKRTCPHCHKVFDTKRDMNIHRFQGYCSPTPTTDEPSAPDGRQETSGDRSEVAAVGDGHTSPAEGPSTAALDGSSLDPDKSFSPVMERRIVRRTYTGSDRVDSESGELQPEAKKTYRRGSMTLEADASKLAAITLGKPAEVIVLRDSGKWKKKILPILHSPEGVAEGSMAMEKFLEQEEGHSIESLLRNIHGIKPDHKVLSAREFKTLYDTLFGGFTSLQLEYYVEWHRKGQPLEKNEDHILDEELSINEDGVVTEDITEEITEDITEEITEDITEDIMNAANDAMNEEITASEDSTETEDVAAKEEETSAVSLSDKPLVYPWMVEQAHWCPEVAGAVEETEYPLRGYILKSMRPKQRLVVQLMRECWGVSAQELQDGNGRLDVRVRDLEFQLLTLGNQRWLHKISRVLLKPGKQMEVIRSQNLIRIVAPKAIAETCMNAIDATIQKIKTKTFKLDQVPMERLDAGILADLGKITNSVVEFGSSHEEVKVSWIDIRNDESQAQLEDLGDVIFRLLLTGHTSASTTNTLIIYPELEGNGRFIEDFDDKHKLSWIDRRREWARLCLPLAPGKTSTKPGCPLQSDALKYKVTPSAEDLALPTSSIKPKVKAYFDNFDFERPLEGKPLAIPKPREKQPEEQESEQLQGLEPTKPTPSGWLPFKVSTKAVFGHILHEQSPSLIQALGQPTASLVNWPRALSPLIPPIANMDLPGWVPYNQPIDATSTILMRFVPYAEDANHADDLTTTKAPHLELRLLASDRRVLAIHSLRAISQISIADILLPAEHVDVRTTQRLQAELPGRVLDTTDGMAALTGFLQASRLEPSRGELVTPPRLRDLGLPAWLLRGDEASPDDEPTSSSSSPADNTLVPTSYVFAGLEVHRAIETTYDGWKLAYTSVEAGQGGGRRAELSLEAVPGYDQSLRRDKTGVTSAHFLRSMYQLARGQKGHVTHGPDGEKIRTSISWVDQEWSG